MSARIEAPNTKRVAEEVCSKGEMRKATGTQAARTQAARADLDTTRWNDHGEAPVMNQPSAAHIAERQSNSGYHQTQHQPNQAVHSYNHAMGTAMQALQLLLALPFLSLQMWQNAMLGDRRLEAKR
jgi:transcription elongation factor